MGAGLVATFVLSMLMLTKAAVPQLDTITMLDGVLRATLAELGQRFPPAPLGGWLWHFVIGTIWWGGLYAIMEPVLPGSQVWIKGLAFGVIATLLVSLMVMPLAGAGYFGMRLSIVQPLVSLLQHLVYGVVLAKVYARLSDPTLSTG